MKLSLIFAIVISESFRNVRLFRRFDLKTEIENKVCDASKYAFEAFYTTSLVRCSLWCKLLPACESFFYSPTSSTCVGCNVTYTATGQPTGEMEGSLFYSKEVLITAVVFGRDYAAIGVGCYSQDCGVLNRNDQCPYGSALTSDYTTIGFCLEDCKEEGYRGFATKEDLCYCDYEAQEKASNCSSKCVGDSSQICGGDGKVSMFNIIRVKDL